VIKSRRFNRSNCIWYPSHLRAAYRIGEVKSGACRAAEIQPG
jgi:hypothetical protein